jgi:pyrimidine-specific ribonucleoside hydrolase
LAVSAQAALPVIIDTDMGSDDVMAIAFLLAHQEIPIQAISVVNGLAHVPAGVANARRLVEASGRKSIPVLAGSDTPLQRTADFPREWRDASDRLLLDGPPPPIAPNHPAVNPHTGPVRILALGPLTNLTREMPADVKEIVIMGGTFRVPGNLGDGGAFKTTNTTAEWNFFVDPLAAARVFQSGIPLRVVPLDATSRVKLDAAFVGRFQRECHGPLADIVKKVLNSERGMIDQGIFYAWDPLAAAALLDPSVAAWTPAHVSIRVKGNETGRSVIEPGQPNAQIALDASRERFENLFLQAFRLP